MHVFRITVVIHLFVIFSPEVKVTLWMLQLSFSPRQSPPDWGSSGLGNKVRLRRTKQWQKYECLRLALGRACL